jgi:hypothetical protein
MHWCWSMCWFRWSIPGSLHCPYMGSSKNGSVNSLLPSVGLMHPGLLDEEQTLGTSMWDRLITVGIHFNNGLSLKKAYPLNAMSQLPLKHQTLTFRIACFSVSYDACFADLYQFVPCMLYLFVMSVSNHLVVFNKLASRSVHTMSIM